MTKPILECIPNYSEARRPDVVEAIMSSITSVEGVTLLTGIPIWTIIAPF
jgi:glutamate formiminotransferase/formiminotetrahydrofolate cyclodeaminase